MKKRKDHETTNEKQIEISFDKAKEINKPPKSVPNLRVINFSQKVKTPDSVDAILSELRAHANKLPT